MKTTMLWGLVGANALLLGLFLSSFVRENRAEAQVAPVAGGPGEYILCPGSITGIGSEIVYVIDTLNGRMGGIVYDSNTNRLDVMADQDLNRVFQAGQGPQGAMPAGGLRR